MAPYVGLSGVVMNLDELTACGLVRQGTLVEIEAGLSPEQVAAIVKERFGSKATSATTDAIVAANPAEKPRGNAKRDDWEAWALHIGIPEDELIGKTQTEIREIVDAWEAEKAEKEKQEKDSGTGATGDSNTPAGNGNAN